MKQALLVLGPHRSGTSAVTRVLAILGADLPSNLLPAQSDNPAGFWESKDIVELNDHCLALAGLKWHDASQVNPSWFESPAARASLSSLVEVLERDFARSNLFVLKDPRMCLLVPLWLNVLREFGAEPKVVLVVRSPLEVASSLRLRDNFPTAKSLALWLRHTLEAERNTRSIPRTVVFYRHLLSDWRSVVAQVSHDLRLQFPRTSPRAELELEQFLSPELYHHRAGETGPQNGSVPQWISEAYQALRALRWQPDASGPKRRLDRIRAEFDKATALFEPMVIGFQNALDNSLHVLEKERAVLESTRRELDERRAIAESASRMLEEQNELVQQQRAELLRLVDELVAREEEQCRLLLELQTTRAALQGIQASRSWRFTAPCRYLSQGIRRLIATVRSRRSEAAPVSQQFVSSDRADVLGGGEHLCIFAHYDPNNDISEYVFYYLERLRAIGFTIFFVSSIKEAALPPDRYERLLKNCRRTLFRVNRGWDFQSWKDALTQTDLNRVQHLLLANDSVYAPLFGLNELFTAMMARPELDFWGITDSYENGWHLQSYFVFLRPTAFRSKTFEEHFRTDFARLSKREVIEKGEISLSRRLVRAGLRGAAYCPFIAIHNRSLPASANPTHFYWDKLISTCRCPVLKRELVRHNPLGVPNVHRWREFVARHTAYDVSLIQDDLDKG